MLVSYEGALPRVAGERAHGYELKQSFEQEFGDLLPALNAGQIYVTLGGSSGRPRRWTGGAGRQPRQARVRADGGRAVLAAWVEQPVLGRRLKDEFFMKFVVVASTQCWRSRSSFSRGSVAEVPVKRDLNALLELNGKGLRLSS